MPGAERIKELEAKLAEARAKADLRQTQINEHKEFIQRTLERIEVLEAALRGLRTRADFWARDTGRALPAECDEADDVLAAGKEPTR